MTALKGLSAAALRAGRTAATAPTHTPCAARAPTEPREPVREVIPVRCDNARGAGPAVARPNETA